MEATLEALRALELRAVVPAHCTGAAALHRLWAAFPDRLSLGSVGCRFHF